MKPNQHPHFPIKKKQPTPAALLETMIMNSDNWPFPFVNGQRIQQVIAHVVAKKKPIPIDLQPPF